VRIVAWVPSGNEQERAINTALGNRFAPTFCRTEQALWEELHRPGVHVFLLDVGTSRQSTAAGLVASVRSQLPAIRIVGFGWVTKSSSVDILACVRAGLDAIAFRGHCDLGAAIERALAGCSDAEELVLRDVRDWLPVPLYDAVRVLVQRLDQAPSLSLLAKMMGVCERTLQRTSKQNGCGSPSDVMCGVRVLVAIHLLMVDSQPMPHVLARTGYPSTRALHSAMRRFGLPVLRQRRSEGVYASARDEVLRRISSTYADRKALGRTTARLEVRQWAATPSERALISMERAMHALSRVG